MDLFARLLLYMSRWSRERPRKPLIITVCVVAAAMILILGIEYFFGWPEMLSVNKLPSRPTLQR